MKAILILIIFILFLINPIVGLVGLSLVLFAILGWVLFNIWYERKHGRSFSGVPKMSPYQYEHYVAQHLKNCGFVKAEVTPKSGDFGADILLTDKDGTRMCVQCKQYSKPVGVKAVQEVIGAKAYYGCTRAAVITTSTFTPAAKELAQRSGVELYEKFYPKTKDDLDWIDRMEEIDSIIED